MIRREYRRRCRAARALQKCPNWKTTSEITPTHASIIAMAISDACVAGSVCSHVRVRHSTPAQVRPIHSRNSELPARSSQKLRVQRLARDREHQRHQLDDQHDREHRARFAEIRQEARVEDGPRVSEADAAIAAQPHGSRRWLLVGGREQRVLEAEQRRDVLVAVTLLDQPPVMHQRHLDQRQLHAVARGHRAADLQVFLVQPHAEARRDSCRAGCSARDARSTSSSPRPCRAFRSGGRAAGPRTSRTPSLPRRPG